MLTFFLGIQSPVRGQNPFLSVLSALMGAKWAELQLWGLLETTEEVAVETSLPPGPDPTLTLQINL